MGHQVRIVAAQFVKPYVKSQKNDIIDAQAIAEAVTRPTMRFTQPRTAEQVDHGARSCVAHLDRARDGLGTWIDALRARMHVNKVIVALAAKIARMAWAIVTKPGATYARREPATA